MRPCHADVVAVTREARALDDEAVRRLSGHAALAELARRRGRDQGLDVAGRIALALRASVDAGEPIRGVYRLIQRASTLRWGLVTLHEGLARSCAERWSWSNDRAEAVQVARLGLYQAACRFDPDANVLFATYARWWARAAITREFRPPGLPSGIRELLRNLRKLELLGVVDEAIQAEHLGCTLERLREVRAADLTVVSLEAPYGGLEDGDTLADHITADTDEDAPDPADAATVRRLVEALPPREARVIRRRFGLLDGDPQSLAAIGAELGVSRERVRQIERDGLEQLRARLRAGP